MPAITGIAPAKIILFGEHAVVYGRPAIAVPVSQVQARVMAMAAPRAPVGEVLLQAPDIGLQARLQDLPQDHPLGLAVRSVLKELGLARSPACTLRVTSTIPMAAGLGSGAAVAVALIRVYSTFLGHPLSADRISALAYEVEKLHHGTPSGIDNTVVTYALPVIFTRGQPLEILRLPRPFTVVIGDTGIQSPTAVAVGDLRRLWQAEPARFEEIFDAVGQIVQQARLAIESGAPESLGALMNTNHAYLQQMDVSALELDRLVNVARAAGASGAKLSGGGRGGNMIALANPEHAPVVAEALRSAGAVRTIITQVQAPG
jgi:mevalonate kinase